MTHTNQTTQETPVFEIKIGGEMAGTHLHGYMTANYRDIVKLLGKPIGNDGHKVDAEWVCTITGKVITIYNYKDGKNYQGKSGIATTKLTDWHIGACQDITEEVNFLATKLKTTFRATY